jgi:type VI secretion system protein ImpE
VTSGTIGDKKFEWIADADGRLGPVCEAILNGKYYWIPFCRLARIEMEAPVDLRDFVWAPATLTFVNGGQSVALIPTRYPGTEKSGDDLARLARKTEWIEAGEGVYRGLGQRMWATSEEEYPLLDVRTVELVDAAVA